MSTHEYPLLCSKGETCRPADKGGPRRTNHAWLCEVCTERLREDLTTGPKDYHSGRYEKPGIADAWADLEDALMRSEAPEGETGKQKRGMVAVGSGVNEKASEARALATNLVWFVLQVARDVADERKRSFRPPHGDLGVLARWAADWAVDDVVRYAGEHECVDIANDARTVARAVYSAAYPSGVHWVEVGLPCEDHGTSELGERIPCAGVMRALVGTGAIPDLVCNVDESHILEPARWEREGWRRAHRKFNPAGVANIARKLAM